MYTSLYLVVAIKKISNLIFIIQQVLRFLIAGLFYALFFATETDKQGVILSLLPTGSGILGSRYLDFCLCGNENRYTRNQL